MTETARLRRLRAARAVAVREVGGDASSTSSSRATCSSCAARSLDPLAGTRCPSRRSTAASSRRSGALDGVDLDGLRAAAERSREEFAGLSLFGLVGEQPELRPLLRRSILYETLGPTLPDGAAAGRDALAERRTASRRCSPTRCGAPGSRARASRSARRCSTHPVVPLGARLHRRRVPGDVRAARLPRQADQADDPRARSTSSPGSRTSCTSRSIPSTRSCCRRASGGRARRTRSSAIRPGARRTRDGALRVHPDDAGRLGLERRRPRAPDHPARQRRGDRRGQRRAPARVRLAAERPRPLLPRRRRRERRLRRRAERPHLDGRPRLARGHAAPQARPRAARGGVAVSADGGGLIVKPAARCRRRVPRAVARHGEQPVAPGASARASRPEKPSVLRPAGSLSDTAAARGDRPLTARTGAVAPRRRHAPPADPAPPHQALRGERDPRAPRR